MLKNGGAQGPKLHKIDKIEDIRAGVHNAPSGMLKNWTLL